MKLRFLFPIFLLAVVGILSCDRDNPTLSTEDNSVKSFDHSIIKDWNELHLIINKDALGYRPVPDGRAAAYIGWATYEACVPGMPEYNSLKNHPSFVGANLPEFDTKKQMYWPEVVNEVYSYLLSRMYEKVQYFTSSTGSHLTSEQVQRLIRDLKAAKEQEYQSITDLTTFNNSKAWGEEISKAVWDWAVTDQYAHEGYNDMLNQGKYYYDSEKEFGFKFKTGNRKPGIWEPTDDNPNAGMWPLAGKNRAFVSSGPQLICQAPASYMAYSEDPKSAYYNQNLEVYIRSFTNPTYDDIWVSEFWSDDLFGLTFSPPLRTVAILDQIMDLDDTKLDKAIYANAMLGIGLNDFGIVCWNSKYYYKIERPEHFIKKLIDPNFQPALKHPYTGVTGITPPFPAYPSGHSTFAGGGFLILGKVFGDDFAFTDNCHINRGEFNGRARSYRSLARAGWEDATSRIPLGVHIRQDCEEGIRLGQEIAQRVTSLPWKK
ncbi:MAG: vanadium-dependent haloperoxidase [Saprospiraceae bacterium]|nr:vanadium-dependent haloperoxidase [Saprospiraceae bacterium]